LGVWVAHGEGKFDLPLSEDNYIYSYEIQLFRLSANPNGSAFDAAAICSPDGRHWP
jgi:phosphoribosylformylglycinamidine synthase